MLPTLEHLQMGYERSNRITGLKFKIYNLIIKSLGFDFIKLLGAYLGRVYEVRRLTKRLKLL
jgi:hypothetical protein